MNKQQREEYDMELMGGILKGCLSAVVFWIVLIMLVLLFAGCKTRTIIVETVRTDTTYITKHQRDSIYIQDSTHVSEQQHGDTMYIKITKWHTKYVGRAVHDTTYIATHDTIPAPYPVEVEVPRKLNWLQKTLQRIGGIALGLLFLWLGWQVWKIYKRRF